MQFVAGLSLSLDGEVRKTYANCQTAIAQRQSVKSEKKNTQRESQLKRRDENEETETKKRNEKKAINTGSYTHINKNNDKKRRILNNTDYAK